MFDLSFDCKDTKKISQYQILEQRIQRKIDFSLLSRDKIRRKSISPPQLFYFSQTPKKSSAFTRTRKTFNVNYQLSTINSDAYYDLQGRRLDGKPTQPGVYIYKGKKGFVKVSD